MSEGVFGTVMVLILFLVLLLIAILFIAAISGTLDSVTGVLKIATG